MAMISSPNLAPRDQAGSTYIHYTLYYLRIRLRRQLELLYAVAIEVTGTIGRDGTGRAAAATETD